MDNEASPLANTPQQSAIYAGYLSEYQTLMISSSSEHYRYPLCLVLTSLPDVFKPLMG